MSPLNYFHIRFQTLMNNSTTNQLTADIHKADKIENIAKESKSKTYEMNKGISVAICSEVRLQSNRDNKVPPNRQGSPNDL